MSSVGQLTFPVMFAAAMGEWSESNESVELFEGLKAIDVLNFAEQLDGREWTNSGNGSQKLRLFFVAGCALELSHFN